MEKEQFKILIVDDIPQNIQVVANILKHEGYGISHTRSGATALARVQDDPFDLILLDIMMPDMDGFEVLRHLQQDEKTKGIPVIFLSALNDQENTIKGFELGAVDYVTKPFNPPELLARVKTHLNLKKAYEINLELQKKNTVLAMAVTANHEINQPLMTISANLEMIEMTYPKGEFNEHVEKYFLAIKNSLDRIKNLLGKFKEAQSFEFSLYSQASQMITFKDQDKPD